MSEGGCRCTPAIRPPRRAGGDAGHGGLWLPSSSMGSPPSRCSPWAAPPPHASYDLAWNNSTPAWPLSYQRRDMRVVVSYRPANARAPIKNNAGLDPGMAFVMIIRGNCIFNRKEYAEKAKTFPVSANNESKPCLYVLFKQATVSPVNTDFSWTVCGFFYTRITIADGVTPPDTVTPPPNGSLAAGLPSPHPIADNSVLQWLHLANTSATTEFNA
ncbi:hypothetical protein ACQ4PT_022810 [Festuca glaucescens]